MSEPYGNKKESSASSSATSSPSSILPQMLDKYSSIYNKNGRIGIYTREERDNIINRFYEKRKKRVWKKRIRYHCRKNLADSRIRVKGRFVKNQTEEEEEYESGPEEEENMKDALVAALLKASQLPYSSSLDLKTPPKPPTRSSTKRPSPSTPSTITPTFKEKPIKDEREDSISAPEELEQDMNSSIAESVRRRKRMRRHSIAY